MAIGTPTVCFKGRVSSGSPGNPAFSPTTGLTAGDLAVLITADISYSTTGTVTGVSDTKGNTWAIDHVATSGALGIVVASSVLTSSLTTADTVTVARSASANSNWDTFLLDVSGIASSSPFDQAADSNGTGTAYTAGPTLALAQADEIAFGAWTQGSTATPTQTATAPWTGLGNAATCTLVYQIVSATTALTAAETSTSATWLGTIATYKAAAAASSGSSLALSSHPGRFLRQKGIR